MFSLICIISYNSFILTSSTMPLLPEENGIAEISFVARCLMSIVSRTLFVSLSGSNFISIREILCTGVISMVYSAG